MSASTLQSDATPSLTPEVLLRAVRKHWLVASASALAVFFAVAFYTFGQTEIYQATATIHIDPTPPRPLGRDVQGVVDMGVGSFWANKEYYATQYKLIASRAVAVETVQLLGLKDDRRFLANTAPNQPDPPFEQEVTEEFAASILKGRLIVAPVKESRLVVVSLQDADPERAQRILTTLIDVYLSRNVNVVVASTSSASEWLGDQVGKLKTELESTEMALHSYKKDKRILSVSLDDQSNMLREEMQQLNQALTSVQTRREALLARYRELAEIDGNDPENLPATELINNALLNNLRVDYVRTKVERASLLGSGKAKMHPDVVSANARVGEARAALLAEVRNVKQAVRSDLDAATQEAAGISRLYELAKQRALDLNMLEIEYSRLERTRANAEKLYSLVLERSKESELTELMRFNNITVVDAPSTPPAPIRPRVPLNLGLGMVAGLAIGLVVALGRELMDRRVRSPEDLEQTLGLPFFGLLPSVESTERRPRRLGRSADEGQSPLEQIAHDSPGGAIAEAARGIRTNLLFASPDKPYRRILITSASPGEGKTMMASTLGIVLAQTGRRVVLVDCDLRRSRLHRAFGILNDLGVTTAVVSPEAINAALRETAVPNLDILPAGPQVATPAEVLQSESFASLLDALEQRYDTVVLDSPPVAVVTDAAVLAKRVDATLVVARVGKTSRDLVRRAVRILRDVGAKLAGCVLNDVDLQKRGYGYYHYYRYYSSGYGSASTSE